MCQKKCFVNYSWDNEEHKEKVLEFVNFLRINSFNVDVDVNKMQSETAINFEEMMHNGLNSDKVIVVLSKGYKSKADTFSGGVGTEYRTIISDIEDEKNKYILVTFECFEEKEEEIVPLFFKGRRVIDLNIDEENDFNSLFRALLDKKEFELAPVGENIPKLKDKQIKDFKVNDQVIEKEENTDIDMFSCSTPFFNYRLGKAFPGVRGIEWINDSREGIKRLSILLREPLSLNKGSAMSDPIWWFRGNSCLDIGKFKIISDEKCVIAGEECLLDKIAIYKSTHYYKSFVYVQFKPEKPTGAQKITSEDIKRQIESANYANEEYGVYKGHCVSRAEYDDGAAVINGQVVEFEERVELRVRYLSKYNFVICAKFHSFNSVEGDKMTEKYLDKMLEDEECFEEFTKMTELLPRHRNDY